MSDEEFEDQLEQEKKAKVEEEEREVVHQGRTYTDADGTVMEWDPVKKAYFPQIDNDFIARYQMNYGSDASQTGADANTTTSTTDSTADIAKAWQDYYSYYGYPQQEGAQDPADPANNSSNNLQGETGDQQNYTTADYYAYYAYYYGEDYAQKWLNSRMEEEEEEREEEERKKEEEGKKEQEDKEGKGKKKGKDKEAVKRKGQPDQPPAWFDMDSEKSTHVYVSGLPSDLTDEEFRELMAKCGLIMFDPHTHKPKLKLYRNSDGSLKGDGLCCYIKQESVDLALNILDGSIVHDKTISVERAKFEMKGDFDPSKKKKKLSNKAKRKQKEKQEKLFDWRPDKVEGVRMRFERIVILKNMFDVKEFETDPSLINELRDDVRTECAKFGDVRKVQVHDRHAEGVISITFRAPEEADMCISALNGRWFAKRQVKAETYDGKTKYQVDETDAEREERLRGWEAFIAGDGESSKRKPPASDSGSKDQQGSSSSNSSNSGSQGQSGTTGANTPAAVSIPAVAPSSSSSSGSAAAAASGGVTERGAGSGDGGGGGGGETTVQEPQDCQSGAAQ